MVGGRVGVVAVVLAAVAAMASCGGDSAQTGDTLGPGPDGGGTAGPGTNGCSDLFDQGKLRTYSIDIDPAEWDKMVAEFHDPKAVTGVDFAVFHPVVMRLEGETVTDAAIKLHGQSSWWQTAMWDGDRAKMQFEVSFDEVNPDKKFHGISQIIFDMPRNDWTFMHDRLAHTWLRQIGIMSTCANNARLEINGAYYGLFVTMEDYTGRLTEQFFPSAPDGDLWKRGYELKTNKQTADHARQAAFWAATDLAAMSAIVDIEGSLRSWAAEALLVNADGYYGGLHNFLIYDQGAKGFVFLPQDTDATFDYLELFDLPGSQNHPVFWWADRAVPTPIPGQHWLIVMSDADMRRKYAEAIAALLDKWDEAEMLGRIDTWSKQIAADVAADPHTWATVPDVATALAAARAVVKDRPAYLRSFVACERDGTGADGDGDGFRWCDDCRDDDPAIYLGAPERCNGVDDNCNHTVDEGCL